MLNQFVVMRQVIYQVLQVPEHPNPITGDQLREVIEIYANYPTVATRDRDLGLNNLPLLPYCTVPPEQAASLLFAFRKRQIPYFCQATQMFYSPVESRRRTIA